MPENRYNHKNRRKFMLKVHIVLVTKYRKQLLRGKMEEDLKQKIYDLSEIFCFSIIAMETDLDHIHVLLEYDTTERVCNIVKIIKQHTTYYLWERHTELLLNQYWKKRIFWSDGYFACSIGEVSSATIEKYIASQG